MLKASKVFGHDNVDGLLTLLVDGARIINIATRGFESMLVGVLSRCQPVYNILVSYGYSKLGEDEAEPEVVVAVAGRVVVRFDERQFLALLFQLPPRFTRLDPLAADTFSYFETRCAEIPARSMHSKGNERLYMVNVCVGRPLALF